MPDYILSSDEELARLQLQARVWEPAAEALFEQIGIAPGWSCVDLGCGAMGVIGPLARGVGPTGRVIGLDQDTSLLQAVQAYLKQEQLDNVELLEGDIHATGLPYNSFDLVHERFVLPYVDPQHVINEMIALARPGGIVVVEEPDQDAWNYYPEIPSWPQFKQVIEATFGLRGDINIGRRTFKMLRNSGLEHVQIRAAAIALHDSHPYMRLPIIALSALRPVMIEAGLVTETELDHYVAELEIAISDPDSYAIMFTTTQVWGRKPLA